MKQGELANYLDENYGLDLCLRTGVSRDCSCSECIDPDREIHSPEDKCPDCGGKLYPEPNLEHGTRYEKTGGVACLDCSWYEKQYS